MSDLISRQAVIDALNQLRETTYATDYGIVDCDDAISAIATLPSAQPKPSEAARDIATIIENEKDMRVITDNNLLYQRGYEDGFREGRTRTELLERFDDDLK